MELVKASGLPLNLGIVQTAYANGSSTNYISEILVGIPEFIYLILNKDMA